MQTNHLTIDRIVNLHEPDAFMRMYLHNDFYTVKIRYLQTNYEQHKQHLDFRAEDVVITILPKQPRYPDILFTLQQGDNIQQAIGIYAPANQFLILENEIDENVASTLAAQTTIRELKQIIHAWFPTLITM